MAFNGTEGRPITLEQAKRWTKRYQDENKGAVKAHFYGCERLRELLDEPECVGIRIYYGLDDDGKRKLVLVGAKADQNNILPQEEGKGPQHQILNDGRDCPPACPDFLEDQL
ncbi:hypothetical protein FNH22_12565 [Fulvivirga sp. M361]|uniref:hypothetical protein n=1 Tax=Fulvivirga sp. M361 TaxID=2594266 RepID=UPI001179CB9F|nr:hypothetical protein [Fulvivirga sp. M361]TRX58704.1 hypothetical protein FNH22_12565 [Fulvivirga sp. M361]